ncbi:MAG: Hsp20/alpha crystallin family protein [Dehalococcoidia bacterium]|nr:Hsp20/alpha crystallin family protein [Dehalococcoidia bacterium]
MTDLIRWEPMGMTSLRQAMDHLFEDSFVRPSGLFSALRAESPAVDMFQTDKDVVVKASLPGMKADDVDISVTGDVLTIKGEHREEQEIKEENYFRKEMRFGSFARSLEIPVPVKVDKAEATFENGVLTLTLPKTEAVQPKAIKVKAAKPAEPKSGVEKK